MLAAAITDLARQCLAGLRILVVLTLILGVAYPAAVWLAGRALGDRADGQPVHVAGQVVGSRLIGQDFAGDRWFHPRPSATGYDAPAPGPSNLGPSNPELIAEIRARRAAVAEAESVTPGAVPPDAVTASASGVDPHISPEYAAIQVARVARVNGLSAREVRSLVAEHTDGRALGFLGEPGVNVLELNLAVLRAAA